MAPQYVDVEKEECEHGMWVLAYDLRSGRADSVDDEDRSWLEKMRIGIWSEIRYTYKCSPIQQSFWLVREEETMEKLKDQVAVWKAQYEARGYPVRLAILPIKTSEEGYQTFREMEFDYLLEWLAGTMKQLDKSLQARKMLSRQHRMAESKVKLITEIIREDFPQHPRLNEVNSIVIAVRDKLVQANKLVKRRMAKEEESE